MFGTEFALGDTVIVDRSPKLPHIGMVVDTDDCFLKIVRDGESVIYPAVYYPPECSILEG